MQESCWALVPAGSFGRLLNEGKQDGFIHGGREHTANPLWPKVGCWKVVGVVFVVSCVMLGVKEEEGRFSPCWGGVQLPSSSGDGHMEGVLLVPGNGNCTFN